MAETIEISVAGVDRPLLCRTDQTILDAALTADLPLPYQCRSGECGNCIATMAKGSVTEMPGADPAIFDDRDRALGRILTCNSLPNESLTIEIPLRNGAGAAPVETINCMVEAIDWVTPTIADIEIGTPWPIRYAAGQYFELALPGIASSRNFSAANRTGSDRLHFNIRYYEGGQVSEYVRQKMYPGEIVRIIGPYGRFGWTGGTGKPAIMIAGGSGLAPIKAMLEDRKAYTDIPNIRFFYGARRGDELYALPFFAELAEQDDRFSFIPVVEDPEGSPVMAQAGHVTDALALMAGDCTGHEAYLCGPPAMIDAAVAVLQERGLNPADVRFDKFTPAKST